MSIVRSANLLEPAESRGTHRDMTFVQTRRIVFCSASRMHLFCSEFYKYFSDKWPVGPLMISFPFFPCVVVKRTISPVCKRSE